jgi:hypothetical protein
MDPSTKGITSISDDETEDRWDLPLQLITITGDRFRESLRVAAKWR